MGVTYKLKDDVVQFILLKKQESPGISCRKLVEIIQESFKISVSKSSIHIIIKDAHLSNPVGRTSLSSNKVKFKIPTDKKTELFEKTKPTLEGMGLKEAGTSTPLPSVQEQGAVPEPPQAPENLKSVTVSKEESLRLKAALEAILFMAPAEPAKALVTPPSPEIPAEPLPESAIEKEANEAEVQEERMSLRPDPVVQSPSETQEEVLPPVIIENKAPEIEGFDAPHIGDIFLRMALWDLTRRPFLESFFKHHTNLSDEDIKILDALMGFWGDTLDDPLKTLDADRVWLWRLSGFTSPPSAERIQELLQKINGAQISIFDLYLEASYFFSFAYEARIVLDDESVVRLNPRWTSFNQTKDHPCPTDSSVEKISQFMTERENETILFCPSLPDMFEDFKNFVAACEGVHKKIEKIILYNAAGQELSEFSGVAAFKRKFVVVARATAAQVKELFGTDVLLSQDNTVMLDGHSMFWADQQAQVSGLENLRLIVLSSALESVEPLLVIGMPFFNQEPLKHLQKAIKSQLPENKWVIDLEVPSLLSGNESQMPLGQVLMLIKGKVEQYCHTIVKNANISEDEFVNISKSMGYVKIMEKSDILESKVTAMPWENSARKFILQLNGYKISNYDQKPIQIITKE